MKTLLLGAATLAFAIPATAQWAETTPASSPAGRGAHGMAYDQNSGAILVFGGDTFGFPAGASDQTWSFDGTTWTNRNPAVSPPASVGVGLVHDSNRGVFVTYGSLATGFFGGPSADRTWEYDPIANTWTENLLLTTTPGGLALYGMCFDSDRNVTVLYGGLPNNFFPIDAADTWEYDGNDWTLVTTTGTPGPLERTAMCHHEALDVNVLFGGIDVQIGGNDNVWLYANDGLGNATWTTANVTGPRPSARAGCKMVYDSARGVCVMTGGSDPMTGAPFGDTWELMLDAAGNGTWQQIQSSYTNARLDAGLAYDPTRRQVVMFGGYDFQTFQAFGDTWEFGAKSRTFGAGCTGSNGVPALDAVDAPRLGQSYVLDATNLPTSLSTAIFVLSLSSIPPTPLGGIGMVGCTGYVPADLLLAVTGTAGAASATIVMPTSSTFVGTAIYTQALSLDPNLNPVWLAASNAHEGVLGG